MNNSLNYQIKKRIISVFIIFLVIILLLGIRLFWIQVVRSEEYKNKALEQRIRELQVEPKRGIIYDQNDSQLAASVSRQTVVAIPPEIQNAEETAQRLNSILETDYQTIYQRLTRSASAVYVERKISDEQVNQIRELDLSGITFTEESQRYYPHNNLASHILGFAGIDSQGLEGLELSYDRYLRGQPGKIAVERDASGRTIPGGVEMFVEPEDGHDIQLTIDEVIQYIVERELEKGMEELDISAGTALVMNPDDGSLLALANRPDYDPNSFSEFEQSDWRNRAISDSFEPGSTFKIVTLASALEQGVVDENDVFVCDGEIKVGGERIQCWKSGGHGQQSLAEVVQNSCNPGFVQIGMKLGPENFLNYIESFNFGQQTGIRLPGEAGGLVYDFAEIGPVEMATMSFGHGITVTPIQLISAASVVASGGDLLRPRLVDEIRHREDPEQIEENEPEKIRQIISESTAEQTRELLGNVVEEGTGENAKIEGYKIGGKTGTAKHYGEEAYDTSFVGMLPLDDPQLVILVVLYDVTDYPYYGSQTAAPIFRNIANDIIRYLDISPAEENESEIGREEIKEIDLPDVEEMRVHEAESKLRENNLNVNIVGNGEYVYHQTPLPEAKIKENTTVILFTEANYENLQSYYLSVPDLTGYQVEEAEELLDRIGLKLVVAGEGSRESEIIDQELNPGERIPAGTEIPVEVENSN